jgi:hypothetical protein
MAELWGKHYTRAELLERVGNLRQLADVRAFEYSDGPERGTRAVSLRNAAGLSLRVLLDRGMGLYDLQFQGIPVPFLSAAGAVHPAFFEPGGLGWLRTWPGGFLTPCGLTQVGGPCRDGDEELGLHGRAAGLPASNAAWNVEWKGEDCILWVEGEMRQSAVFGENLLLRRRIWTKLSSASLWIEDEVENQGMKTSPHMFLQHINLGFPLVGSTARLVLPEHTTLPRDEAAAAGLADCLSFSEPIPDYAEQVFYHDLTAGADGLVEVSLVNPAFNAGQGLGLTLRYLKEQYPVFVEWKCMLAGTYVVGLEPANCHVGGRAAERAAGTLQFLQPGEVRRYALEFEFFH